MLIQDSTPLHTGAELDKFNWGLKRKKLNTLTVLFIKIDVLHQF